ncbi:hypothetical protein BH18ACT9_BH18ACT9_15910 [soil metagenome]
MTSPDPTGAVDSRLLAWAWVDHVRDGGTTPWREFSSSDAGPTVGPRSGRLPGAAQLELLRRLNARAATVPGVLPGEHATIVELALSRTGPGRGLPELPLHLPGGAQTRVGAPQTDPADISVAELVRDGVGLLVAELLRVEVRVAEPRATPIGNRIRRRLTSRAFRLVGAPTTAAVVRSALAARGRSAGGRSPEVILFAAPVEELLGQVWSASVQRGTAMAWERCAERWSRRGGLPGPADLPRLADSFARQVGAARVHVVIGGDAVRSTTQLLGIGNRGKRPASSPRPMPLTAAGTDLLRRVNQVLDVRVPKDQKPAFRDAVTSTLPWLPEGSVDPGLVVPPQHRSWVREQAARVVDELSRGGYPVHGDLEQIALRRDGPVHPSRPEVLDLVLDSVLRIAQHAPGPDRPRSREGRGR